MIFMWLQLEKKPDGKNEKISNIDFHIADACDSLGEPVLGDL